jgi:hypothetical protein
VSSHALEDTVWGQVPRAFPRELVTQGQDLARKPLALRRAELEGTGDRQVPR